MSDKKKEEVLIVVGLNRSTIESTLSNGTVNRWKIEAGNIILEKVLDLMDQKNFSKVVFFESDKDYINFDLKKTMCIKKHGDSFLSKDNELVIYNHEYEEIFLNGDQFDFILPPDKTKVTVVGIDLLCSLSNTVVELSNIGYHVTVYPFLIKAYKDVTYDKIKGKCQILSK